jgi:hypothetical protein
MISRDEYLRHIMSLKALRSSIYGILFLSTKFFPKAFFFMRDRASKHSILQSHERVNKDLAGYLSASENIVSNRDFIIDIYIYDALIYSLIVSTYDNTFL